MTVRASWDGNEWQAHCCELLAMRYGEDVQFVPDRKDGDGGMEAFRLDDGIVYQCYAPEAAFTIDLQTDAQKKKIRDDVAKLSRDVVETMRLLGTGYLIRRWVLLTPDFDDKELVKYASYKSKKVRDSKPCPVWCHGDFRIVVATDRHSFPAELAARQGVASGQIRLQLPDPVDEQLADARSGLGGRLKDKLLVSRELATDTQWLEQVHSDMLWEYVYGKSQLQELQDRYGLAYEAVTRRARMVGRGLSRRLDEDAEDLVKRLADGLSADVPQLARIACEELARHYVAGWWVECPLRYQGTSA